MEITVRTYDEVSNERVRIEVAPGQRAEIHIVDDRVSTYEYPPANAFVEGLAEQYARAQARVKELEELVKVMPTERLYTAEEVGDLQAREAELVATPLRRQVQELERKLAESRELVVFKDKIRADVDHENIKLREKVRELSDQVRERQARIKELEDQVREYDRDRKTERDRADGNKAWAERAEQRLADQAQAWAERADRQLADQAEEHRQSLATRDRLLSTSVRKVNEAREVLSRKPVAEAREKTVTTVGAVMADAIGAALRVLDQA